MAEIDTGLYYIVEASNTSKCLGVVGWSSNNEANVKEHTLSKTEGQTCFVEKSESGNGYTIGFPLTGKVMCVADRGSGSGSWYVGGAFTQSQDGDTGEWVQSTTQIPYVYEGDVYLNWARFSTYRCTSAGNPNTAKWTYTSNVASKLGEVSASANWYRGTAINSIWGGVFKTSEVTNARVGDMYLNANNGFVFRCTTAGAPKIARWEFVADISAARTRTDDGTNVFQHDWDGTAAEVWSIEDASSTVVIEGTTYPTFFIATSLDTSKVLTINSSANAAIYSRTASDSYNKRYAFLPIDTVPEGTYKLVPQSAKTTCIGIQSNSDASGAWCVHEALSDSNSECNYQTWKVDHLANGVCSIRSAGNGLALSAKASKSLWYAATRTWDAGDDELWVMRALGSTKYNGSDMPTYHVAVVEGENNLVLDCFGMQNSATRADSPSKWAPLTAGAHTLARQRYLFVPAEAYAASGVSVPSDLALYMDGERDTLLGADGVIYAYPCWRGSGDEWQVRWCYQYRAVGDTKYCADAIAGSVNGWSPYYSLGDSSKANSGWGTPGQANCTATYVNGWYIADQPIILSKLGISSGKYDGYHIYFDVRQVIHNYGELGVDAHGGTAGGYMWVCWQPTITFSNVTITPEGASLDYVMQPVRGKNNIKVSCEYFSIEATGVKSTGTLMTSKIKSIPDLDSTQIDNVSLSWEITSANELTSTGNTIVNVKNDLGQAQSISGVSEYFSDLTRVLRLQLPTGTLSPRAWLQIDDEDDLIECDIVGRYCYCYYPFNKPFTVICSAIVSGSIRVWKKDYSAIPCKSRFWNWGKTNQTTDHYFELAYNIGSTPQESIKTAPTVQSRKTTMRKWGLTQVGNSFDRTHSVTGALADKLFADSFAAINELSQCKFAWYRNPEGEVVRVAVTSVTTNEIQEGLHQISVENRRVDA